MYSGAQWHDASLVVREDLRPGDVIPGPAIIAEKNATTVVEPGWEATLTALDHLVLERRTPRATAFAAGTQVDPVLLEVFNNLFMNIAEQMGLQLQNTAYSVNIKERLDFSCALFDADGNLIANAPHMPVHLGSMGESIKTVIRENAGKMSPGDVYVLNDPYHGGTHLPDVTVITPVYLVTPSPSEGRAEVGVGTCRLWNPRFLWVPGDTMRTSAEVRRDRCRRSRPTSRRKVSRSTTSSWWIAEPARSRDACAAERKTSRSGEGGGPPRRRAAPRRGSPGGQRTSRSGGVGAMYPSRNPEQNMADLKAQIAANEKGVQELRKMVEQFGLDVVQAYMGHVQDNAEESVRRVITRLRDGRFTLPLDNGAQIRVAIRVDAAGRSAEIDFAGTSPQQTNNFNAPTAVAWPLCSTCSARWWTTTSAQRRMPQAAEGADPAGLHAEPEPACVGRGGKCRDLSCITNALFGALGVMASSQCTMNNFTFGNERHQYYETISGGSGAGAEIDGEGRVIGGFDGTSVVQTHMTNSRLTDPEVLEFRFPVRLESYEIRAGSGGRGRWKGGDGGIRRVRFLEEMTASILSNGRRHGAFGMASWRARAGGDQPRRAQRRQHRGTGPHRPGADAARRHLRDPHAGRRRLRQTGIGCAMDSNSSTTTASSPATTAGSTGGSTTPANGFRTPSDAIAAPSSAPSTTR